jgi:serine/threonine protein kinase
MSAQTKIKVQAILNNCAQATAHRASCGRLALKCEAFLLDNARYPSSSVALLDELLKEILPFVEKFISPADRNPKSTNDADVMLWFEGVLDELTSDLKSFQEFNQRIDELGAELGTSPGHLHHDISECEGIVNDLETLFQSISAFQRVRGHTCEGSPIARCLSLKAQWSEINTKLSQYQDQINQLIGKRDTQNFSANEETQQLAQIYRSIEDILHSSALLPQQLVLVNSLNDSLVGSLGGFHPSLLDTFSAELEFSDWNQRIRRHQTLQDYQNNLIRDNHNTILSTLERMEFTKREEFVRQDRLGRLKKFPSHYSIDQESFLGRGRFAVKGGRLDDHSVAIKIIQVKGRSSFNTSMKSAIENEVLLMSLCDHPCVLKLYGFCEVDPRTTHLILELGTMGSLWSMLENKVRFPFIPLSLSIAWIADILSALCYLHELKIVHRDVKAENVLLCDGLVCKLTDFGLSRQQRESSFSGLSVTQGGTLPFMAPETFPPHGSCSHRSDVYSCGVTCFQIVSRSSPPSHSEISSQLKRSIMAESWERFVDGSLALDYRQRLSSPESLRLIREVQASDLIGGNPRDSPAHATYGEMRVLQLILTADHAEETQRPLDRSVYFLPYEPPLSSFRRNYISPSSRCLIVGIGKLSTNWSPYQPTTRWFVWVICCCFSPAPMRGWFLLIKSERLPSAEWLFQSWRERFVRIAASSTSCVGKRPENRNMDC